MSADTKHEHGWAAYYVVFNALIFLTVVTVAVSYVDLGALLTSAMELARSKVSFLPKMEFGHGANIALGLLVAVIKASLVVWWFMHQKYEENLNRWTLGFCLGLFVLVVIAFSADFVWFGTYVVEGLSRGAVGGH